ncbi:DUF5946 family protein [Bacillus sp. 1NLA3E]|uniref:DUF5946 family protein n=1 Tax=Bacillus sp. 1NLA3E TaxID=666686 RepID=UPI000247EDAB|nr:DUF5946 family protein [Bacillus sp. 1NLA3E]
MGTKMIKCPGCGLTLPDQQIVLPNRYNATGECYQKYSELSTYTLNKQDIYFNHQHAIDTYSAQHSGSGMKNITTAYSLIGLYYAIEHGYTGKQVQHIHMLLSKQKYNWQGLQPPNKHYSITVYDVLKEEPGEKRDVMLRNWMDDVWNCWKDQHQWVRDIMKSLLK